MRIVEHSNIDRPAVQVWPFIVSPEQFQKWNTKIIAMDAKGEFRLGQSFVTHYKMSGKQIQCQSVATAIEPNRLLELRHAKPIGNNINPALEVRERITLKETDGRTVVTKEVVITHSGIPWIAVPLIWLITRLGKSTDPDTLKMLCEGDAPPVSPRY